MEYSFRHRWPVYYYLSHGRVIKTRDSSYSVHYIILYAYVWAWWIVFVQDHLTEANEQTCSLQLTDSEYLIGQDTRSAIENITGSATGSSAGKDDQKWYRKYYWNQVQAELVPEVQLG